MNHFITTHAGTAACILMTVCMLLTALPFLIKKEKAAILVSGFNTLTKEDQKTTIQGN